MRWIKLAVISFAGIGLLVMALSLLIPSRTRVSRAITIQSPADSVHARLVHLGDWTSWNQLLRDAQLTGIRSTDSSFHSNQMEVKRVNLPDGRIVTYWSWHNQEPVYSEINLTAAGEDATIVQWFFEFRVNWYPWEKFGSIVFDKQLGLPMEQSLDLLKAQCE